MLEIYLHPRDEQGRVKMDDPGDGGPTDPESLYRRYLWLNRITIKALQDRLYGDYRRRSQ